eukprot:12423764-Karenia_brevis.AAC.1
MNKVGEELRPRSKPLVTSLGGPRCRPRTNLTHRCCRSSQTFDMSHWGTPCATNTCCIQVNNMCSKACLKSPIS